MTVTAQPASKASKAPRLVYALTQYSVEQRGSKWWYAPTTEQFRNGAGKWIGPYASLHTVAFAIATALKREARQRHEKRCVSLGHKP